MNPETVNSPAERYLELVRVLFIALTVLQLADWDSSVRGLQMGRQEQNILITFMAGHVGILAAVTITKLAALLLTWGYLKMAARRDTRTVLVPLALVTSIYAVIVINNYI